MILRPETQALLDSALKCLAFLYGVTRYAGKSNLGLERVTFDESLVRALQGDLTEALAPFGQERIDIAHKAAAQVMRQLEKTALHRFDAAWGGK